MAGRTLPQRSENSLYNPGQKNRKILVNFDATWPAGVRIDIRKARVRRAFSYSGIPGKRLEQTDDFSVPDINRVRGRYLWQPRHSENLAADCHHKFGTRGQSHFTYRNCEPCRRAL